MSQFFWNHFGVLNANLDKFENTNENAIMYTALHSLITNQRNLRFEEYVASCYKNGRFFSYPYLTGKENEDFISHDNLTSLTAYSKHFKLDWHILIKKEMKAQGYLFYSSDPDKKRRWMHPRDVILWLNIYPLYPLSWFICGLSQVEKYKLRPKLENCIVEFFKTLKWPKRNKIPKTDGKILNYMRFYNNKPIFWIMTQLLKLNHLKNYKNVFLTYFPDPNHPVNIAYDIRTK